MYILEALLLTAVLYLPINFCTVTTKFWRAIHKIIYKKFK